MIHFFDLRGVLLIYFLFFLVSCLKVNNEALKLSIIKFSQLLLASGVGICNLLLLQHLASFDHDGRHTALGCIYLSVARGLIKL